MLGTFALINHYSPTPTYKRCIKSQDTSEIKGDKNPTFSPNSQKKSIKVLVCFALSGLIY